MFQLGATFGAGFAAFTSRAIAAAGVVLTKRPHIRPSVYIIGAAQALFVAMILSFFVLATSLRQCRGST
ncbi:hypothetical protein [Acidocella sp. KAb 2-4]|uniref:hypothetical protein n=1 Tax=Acidocella sp. KAb 2-4 TaxID=2885158 RepID=UPI001D09267C|nr:hypothetical protein [Acidocella sp. KAb 2-4]MCB5946086.1 hypothetical protein [Acidocella sp. KAb 2-4]